MYGSTVLAWRCTCSFLQILCQKYSPWHYWFMSLFLNFMLLCCKEFYLLDLPESLAFFCNLALDWWCTPTYINKRNLVASHGFNSIDSSANWFPLFIVGLFHIFLLGGFLWISKANRLDVVAIVSRKMLINLIHSARLDNLKNWKW